MSLGSTISAYNNATHNHIYTQIHSPPSTSSPSLSPSPSPSPSSSSTRRNKHPNGFPFPQPTGQDSRSQTARQALRRFGVASAATNVECYDVHGPSGCGASACSLGRGLAEMWARCGGGEVGVVLRVGCLAWRGEGEIFLEKGGGWWSFLLLRSSSSSLPWLEFSVERVLRRLLTLISSTGFEPKGWMIAGQKRGG